MRKETNVQYPDSSTFEHVYGLPLPEGAVCNVYLCPTQYVFERNENSFELNFSKVVDVTIKTEEENFVNYIYSLKSAAAGYAIAGSLGAAIGMKMEKKVDTIEHHFLIFAYKKDGETVDFISFDCVNDDTAKVFVEAFESLPKRSQSVEL